MNVRSSITLLALATLACDPVIPPSDDAETDAPAVCESESDGSLEPGPCGWTDAHSPAGYYCGAGLVEDPQGQHPYDCPAAMVVGAPCGHVSEIGCCDENLDNWRCVDGVLAYVDCTEI